MKKPNTLTLKIINDQDILDTFPKPRALTEDHKALITMIAKIAVEEYIQKMKASTQEGRSPDRILRFPEVIKIVGLSRAMIYLYIQSGSFPRMIKIGKRSVGWRESVIRDWLEEKQLITSIVEQ